MELYTHALGETRTTLHVLSPVSGCPTPLDGILCTLPMCPEVRSGPELKGLKMPLIIPRPSHHQNAGKEQNKTEAHKRHRHTGAGCFKLRSEYGSIKISQSGSGVQATAEKGARAGLRMWAGLKE